MINKRGFGKKGATKHFEMIIAFSLFVLFVTFLLVFIQPNKKSVLPDTILLSLHDGFENKSGVNLSKVFLKINPEVFLGDLYADVQGSCLVTSFTGVFDLDSLVESNSFTRSALTGNVIDSMLKENLLHLRNEGSDTAYYVFVSENLEESNIQSCPPEHVLETPGQYKIGSLSVVDVLSQVKINELKTTYDEDYSEFKEQLDIPSNIDVSIIAGEVLLERNVPKGVEVLARAYKKDVLLSTGNIERQEFIFKVW